MAWRHDVRSLRSVDGGGLASGFRTENETAHARQRHAESRYVNRVMMHGFTSIEVAPTPGRVRSPTTLKGSWQ